MPFDQLHRRAFISLLGGVAAAWPLAARAQQGERMRRIGFLGASTPTVAGAWFATFQERLRELGWIEGRNIVIEPRWAERRKERATEIATEFVQLKVDIIVTFATEPAIAAKQATSIIPIVFALSSDPVGSGLVASLSRPGGNATGLSSLNIDLVGKRFELLREIVPSLRRLAILANIGVPDAAMETREVQATAGKLGLDVATLEIRRAEEITPAFESFRIRPEALFVVGDPLTLTNRAQINTLAQGARLPTMYSIREFVMAGGLMSYGPNFPDLFRRAADLVDKILRGTNPSDIPVEQPTKFDLVINLTTAKALGLTVPETFLWRADEVIE
jgi:putative ABC transport system substrate-binding protein